MSLFHSPSIITNGLILCIDAANIKSYSGSGTTVVDTIGKQSLSFIGATSWSSNPGSFDTNAINATTDAGLLLANSITQNDGTAWSYEFVWKLITGVTTGTNVLCGIGSTVAPWVSATSLTPLNTSWAMAYRDGTGAFNNSLTITSSRSDAWTHSIFTANTSRSVSFYVNGQLVNSVTAVNTQMIAGKIGGGYFSSPNYAALNGSIALTRIYNTTLSATDVTQNFNAVRGRFGL